MTEPTKSVQLAVECGRRLRQAREVSGYSQAEMARLLDISQQRLDLYESGRSRIMPEVLPTLYLRTGINPDWIFLGDWGRLPWDLAEKLRAAAS